MSQKEKVLRHLKSGTPITPIKAIAEYKAFRLAAIIYELRKEGYNIVTRRRRAFSGAPYAEYELVA